MRAVAVIATISIAIAVIVAVKSHGDADVRTFLVRTLILGAGIVLLGHWRAENGRAVTRRTGSGPLSLSEAFSATWRRVLLHSIGGSLLFSLYLAIDQDPSLSSVLLIAAAFFVPIFLCALIFDLGGALSGYR